MPITTFIGVRIAYGCRLRRFLGLPWPRPLEILVQIICGAIALFALGLVIRDLTFAGVRRYSVVVLIAWAMINPVGLAVLAASIYGDPSASTCPAS